MSHINDSVGQPIGMIGHLNSIDHHGANIKSGTDPTSRSTTGKVTQDSTLHLLLS